MISQKKILSLCPIRAGIKIFNPRGVRTALLKPADFYFTEMKEIYLANINAFTQVDDEDYEYLNQFHWWGRKGRYTYYAERATWDKSTHKRRKGLYWTV